jgi:hypothetical protein
MLWTIAVLLMVGWVLAMVTSHMVGGCIHLLLVLAFSVVLIRIIQGQRTIRVKPLACRMEAREREVL